MKSLIIIFLRTPIVARALLKPLLHLHNKLYYLISMLVVPVHGKHPKHLILLYENWFIKNVDEEDVILDIGCNDGSLSRAISKHVRKVYGIELLQEHVSLAQSLTTNENVEFICADATKYDYGNTESVSKIVMSNVLEHIEERESFLRLLIKNVRWSNDPIFLIRVPTIERDWLSVYKKNIGIEFRLDKTHFIEHTLENFREEIERAGLKVKKIELRFGEIFSVCTLVN